MREVLPAPATGRYIVYVFQDITPSGANSYWDGYNVPNTLGAEVNDVGQVQNKSVLHITLVDRDGNVIVSASKELYGRRPPASCGLQPILKSNQHGFVGPLLWADGYMYTNAFVQKATIAQEFTLNLEDLVKVAKCVAYIEDPRSAEGSN